uniref:Uncharacterized protein n=1 Tax=Meloidogyne hapla TaxID=6305 RepID=A0A1I8C0N8_MELHA
MTELNNNLGKLTKQQRLTKRQTTNNDNNINILERISEKEESFYEKNNQNIFWIEHSRRLVDNKQLDGNLETSIIIPIYEQFVKRKFIIDKMGEKKSVVIEKELLPNLQEFYSEINNNQNDNYMKEIKNHFINERKYYGIKITNYKDEENNEKQIIKVETVSRPKSFKSPFPTLSYLLTPTITPTTTSPKNKILN